MHCTIVGLLLSLVSAAPSPPPIIKPVLATQFAAKGDPWNPDPELACQPGRDLDDSRDVIVAHRTLPCGTRVRICVVRSGACVEARVADRLGPCRPHRCSQLDLAPATARLLRLNRRRGWNGMEPVTIEPLSGPGHKAGRLEKGLASTAAQRPRSDLGSALWNAMCAPPPPPAPAAYSVAAAPLSSSLGLP